MSNKLYKIVLTGGPCGGKSRALPMLKEYFEKQGFYVICIDETATQLIRSGITPTTFDNISIFQKYCVSLQLYKENICISAAKKLNRNVIIFLDRAALDGKAYVDDSIFNEMLSSISQNETNILERYDCVFHLTSASIGAKEYYTTENNSARNETPEEAAAKDSNTFKAWEKHPHHFVIDNSTDFENKLNRLINHIESYIKKISL